MSDTYVGGLGRMVVYATVSHKDTPYDDTGLAKLRATVEELFLLLHQRANRTTFSGDCWFYSLPGKGSSRRVVLMSHHDVGAPIPVPVSFTTGLCPKGLGSHERGAGAKRLRG